MCGGRRKTTGSPAQAPGLPLIWFCCSWSLPIAPCMSPATVYGFRKHCGRPCSLRPPLSVPSPGWENVDDSSCQVIPHLHIWHGKCPFRSFCFRRKAGSQAPVHFLSSLFPLLPSPPHGHSGAQPFCIQPRSGPAQGEEPPALCRGKPGGSCPASDFQSLIVLQVSCSFMPGRFLSHLSCLLPFVANENEDCSALANEIIVTMHTFQDVSGS